MRSAGRELPPPADPAPLAAAMQRVRVALPMVDNLGRTRDDRDLYAHIDDLADGAKAAYPEALCKPGCSGCCKYPAALFTASEAEWGAILDHIAATWPAERIAGFVRRFWASHGPHLRRLEAAEWLMELPFSINPTRAALPLSCPFLEGDRCEIYPVRPTFCRCFGLFTFKYWWQREPTIYSCEEQSDHLEPIVRRPGRARLPSFNPISERRFKLSRRGKRHLLALWVAARWPRRWLADQQAAES